MYGTPIRKSSSKAGGGCVLLREQGGIKVRFSNIENCKAAEKRYGSWQGALGLPGNGETACRGGELIFLE
jgi:hypothetical protein